MIFTFDGQQYRIVFRHDLSRRLTDHVDHEVYLVQDSGRRKNGMRYNRGQAYLVCGDCTAKHKLEKPLKLTGLSKREQKRMTFCVICHLNPEGKWEIGDYTGEATVNTDAGDQFSREVGCRHALTDALTPWVEQNGVRRRFMRGSAEFRAAARDAYNSRKSKSLSEGGV